jgi:hypothetical protein
MAKILLTPVTTDKSDREPTTIFDQKEPLGPNIGLYRMKFFLEKHGGHTVDVEDLNFWTNPEKVLVDKIRKGNYDMVGSATDHLNLEQCLSLSHAVKHDFPEMPFIYGGIQATFDNYTVMKGGKGEIIVTGEGEMPLLDILNRFDELNESDYSLEKFVHSLGDVKGLHLLMKDIGSARHRMSESELSHYTQFTGHRPQLTREQLIHIDSLYDYSEIPYERYWRRMNRFPGHKGRMVNFIVTNYCPGGCAFCSSTNFLTESSGKKAKMYGLDAERIFEIMYGSKGILQNVKGVKKFGWQDDNALFGKAQQERMSVLCDMIIKEIPEDDRVPILCLSRINDIDYELLVKMRKAGVVQIGYGVENFSASGHRGLNKFDKPGYEKTLKRNIFKTLTDTSKAGISNWVNVIMCTPNIDVEGVIDNIVSFEYVHNLKGKIACYPEIIRFPGSALANDSSYDDLTSGGYSPVRDTGVSIYKEGAIMPKDPIVREWNEAAKKESLAVGEEIIEKFEVNEITSEIAALGYTIGLLRTAEDCGVDVPSYQKRFDDLHSRGKMPWPVNLNEEAVFARIGSLCGYSGY